jgi:steroid delta-isomerase-like uncharacterized protein
MATTKVAMTDAELRAHQEAVHRAWNAQDVDGILEHLTDDVVWIEPVLVAPLHGKQAVAGSLRGMFGALPDLKLPVEDIRVATSLDPTFYVAMWTATATMTGSLQGIPATGRTVNWSGTTACTFRDGLISEYRMTYDALSIMQQLGVLPSTDGLGFKSVALVNLMLGRAKHALHR